MPTPAAFRTDALLRADSRLLDNDGSTSVIGLRGREIANTVTDEQMRMQLIRLEKSPDTEALESVYRKGQETIHCSLFPLFASEPTCAACHNKLQRLAGNKQWQVGDLMGAQYIDQNIDHQLTHVNNTVRLVSVLVFLTVLAGSFCCLFLYTQF